MRVKLGQNGHVELDCKNSILLLAAPRSDGCAEKESRFNFHFNNTVPCVISRLDVAFDRPAAARFVTYDDNVIVSGCVAHCADLISMYLVERPAIEPIRSEPAQYGACAPGLLVGTAHMAFKVNEREMNSAGGR